MRLLVVIIWLSLLLPGSAQAAPQADESRIHFNRGVELQQKGDLEGARQAYEEALRLTPRRVDALANLGLVYLNLGRNEKAIEVLSRTLDLKPELTSVRMFLGLARFRAGQFEAAHQELVKVLEAQPAHPQAPHLLGLCLLKLDRIEEGALALEAALQANPNNVEAAYTLATAYIGLGEIEKAEALLEGPLREKTSAEAHLVRGSLLNAKRNAKDAIQELSKAKQLNEKLPTLRTQLGFAYLLLPEYEKAASEFLAELKQTPNDFHANAYLGWLYIQEKRYPEAAERLTKVLRQKPDNATILYQLGNIQFISGQLEDSLRMLEQAVRLRPDFIPPHVLLARVYNKLKRTDDFAREQSIIRQLTEKEQERNLGTQESYVEQENTLPKFIEGLSVRPTSTKKKPQ
ncbi:MAG: tetratricopeptide repeat protein [Blastocatellales bacterium]